MNGKSAVLLVIDGLGVGCLPDAAQYEDTGTSTLSHATENGKLSLPYLTKFGLYKFCGRNGPSQASTGRMVPKSSGKSTVEGHWEMMGQPKIDPFNVFPDGFSSEIMDTISKLIGRGLLGGQPASGTKIIEQLGERHQKTGMPIIYTSADSVLQVAAHENTIPANELYEICKTIRNNFNQPDSFARVIARPFAGEPGNYYRTSRRRDFTLKIPEPNVLSELKKRNINISGVGRIADLFPEYLDTFDNPPGNIECLERTKMYRQMYHGFVFANLEDLDMLYGHRRDKQGYAKSLAELDEAWPKFLMSLANDDLLIVASDHGCDPTHEKHTDHTREYTMLMCYMKGYEGVDLGTRQSLCDVGATILDFFGINPSCGESVLKDVTSCKKKTKTSTNFYNNN